MTAPLLAHTRAELDELLAARRRAGEPVALVPTMGALHDGHAGLMAHARDRVGPGPVVVSIFVNPLQFGEGEDLDRYPRTLEQDLKLCEREGADIVLAPSVEEVYPDGVPRATDTGSVTVDPGELATVLEGATRPGHFRGVLTVVAKLFGLVRPDVAVFGQKDYQQLVLVRRMVTDLAMGVDVVGVETVREAGGLAMSSRNRYLSEEQRRQALTLHRTLLAAQLAAVDGPAAALDAARTELRSSTGVDLDYLELRTADLQRLPPEVPPGTQGRALIAARVGSTRLIDNLPIVFGKSPARPASPSDRERSEPDPAEHKDSAAKRHRAVPGAARPNEVRQ